MPDLPPLVRSLLGPKAYSAKPNRIELVQTQISFVFLVDDTVYKVKKPVDFGFLDFTTLEKRRFFCQQELALNRRLCSDTYLDVVPITQTGDDFVIAGTGEIVEYAVKMHRLPQDRTMDALLRANRVSPEMVRLVAEKMADFHRRSQTITEGFGDLATARTNHEENMAIAQQYVGTTLSTETCQRIKDYNAAFMSEHVRLFEKRVTSGKVKDCHGDLRPDHICFVNGICIFDCIEFNDRFRYIDTASEIAFLAMDLDFYGFPRFSRDLVESYRLLSEDADLEKIVDFYKCYRACVRGKVESLKTNDPYIPVEEKDAAAKTAARYFRLAESYICGESQNETVFGPIHQP